MLTENLTRMRYELPNMYIIAMRGDSKVRIVPTTEEAGDFTGVTESPHELEDEVSECAKGGA